MLNYQNAKLAKFHFVEMSLSKCQVAKMSRCQNVKLPKVIWQNAMAKCQVAKMSSWQNDKLKK
jgi:hypothetical protein